MSADKSISESDKDSEIREICLDYKYACTIEGCHETFKRETYLDRHVYKHTGIKKYKCIYEGCDKEYIITTHLKRHIKITHERISPSKNVPCSINGCKKIFTTHYTMERHIKNVHEDAKIYTCPHCSIKYKRKNHLRRHLVTHMDTPPMQCEKCSKGFIYESDYNRHKCHKTFQCPVCNEIFDKWSLFVDHKRTVHPPSRRCEKCNKEFSARKNYIQHLQNHAAPEDREVVKCPFSFCTRFYLHARNLKAHIKWKHGGQGFKCHYEFCNRILVSKKKLQNHLRLHEIIPASEFKSKKKPKQPRSDSGKPKSCMAAKLANVVVEPKIEKLILSGRGDEVEVPLESYDSTDITDTDNDEKVLGRTIKMELTIEPEDYRLQ